MTRSDAILAAMEHRHAQTLGAQAYADFKHAFRQVARPQRRWREAAADPPSADPRSA